MMEQDVQKNNSEETTVFQLLLRIISSFIPFIKELFFNTPEEADFDSSKFDSKKWVQFALFTFLLMVLGLSGERLYDVSVKYVHLEKQYAVLKKQHDSDTKLIATYKATAERLQVETTTIEDFCKKQQSQRCDAENNPPVVVSKPEPHHAN